MFVSGANHGSAAAVTTAAAMPPLAAGRLTLMPLPSAAEISRAVLIRTQSQALEAPATSQAATESLGNAGIEYS